jgi:hypothetical protein
VAHLILLEDQKTVTIFEWIQLSALGGDRSGSIGEFSIFVIGSQTGKGGKDYRIGKV